MPTAQGSPSLCVPYAGAPRLEWIVDATLPHLPGLNIAASGTMLDILFIALGLGFFAAAALYAIACEGA